jgi:hypothetical protein
MPRQQRTPPPKPPCTYCGQSDAPTMDHTIPRSLFIPPLPSNMVRVPACESCQAEKSWGDHDLAHYVNTHWAGSQHPDSLQQLERMARATELGRSKVGKAFTEGGRQRELLTDAGLYLGEVWEFTIPNDNRDMFRTLEYIVRGLHVVRRRDLRFDRTKQCLPPECPVVVREVDRLKAPAVATRLDALPRELSPVMGKTVAWWLHVPSTDPEAGVWLLVFNNQVCFLGATGGSARLRMEQRRAA